jgi:hypothetical protein
LTWRGCARTWRLRTVNVGSAQAARPSSRWGPGTPAFYLNGRALPVLELTSAEALIQEALAKANREIAAGVRPADYYRVAAEQAGLTRVRGRFEEGPASDPRAPGR